MKSPAVGLPLEGLSYVLPDAMPDKGLFVVDTSDLFAGLEGASTGDRKSLDRVCIHLQIPTESLHNAGNDAHVSFPCHWLNTTLTPCFSTHSRP